MSSGPLLHRYGPWALVTGASDGIGRAFALELAASGFSLVLVARRQQLLAAAASDAEAHGAPSVRQLVLDLTDESALERLLAATVDIDLGLLVAAAGFGTSGPLVASSLEDELAMIDLNCRAVTAQAQWFGQRFAARGRGGLVLMSSLLAFQGVPGAANYAATKAYVQTLAEGLALELKPRGVDVIASAPGPIRSGFAARAGMRMGLSQDPAVVARATLVALGRRTTVRPGWLSVALELALASLPRRGRTRIMARVMAGMIGHHGRDAHEAA